MLHRFLSDNTSIKWTQKLYRLARLILGQRNARLLRAKMHEIRPNISATFDTGVAQLCKVERGGWYSTDNPKFDFGYYGPFARNVGGHEAEIPFINALCEMARRNELDLFAIPTIEKEKRENRHRHADHLGCVNIDHGVIYRDLGFMCPRIGYSLSNYRGFPWGIDSENCSIANGPYFEVFKHFPGKGQVGDAWHLVLCDALGIEIFFTCDEKFLRRCKQVEEKIRMAGIRTKAMRPSEFCKKLNITGIPIAPTDPQGFFRGTIR